MIVKKHDEINLDPKGRFFIPKKERTFLGEKTIVTSGQDCLLFLTEEEWNQTVEEKLSDLKGMELRRMQRTLFSSAFLQAIDSQGRVLIPIQLRKDG